MILNIDGELGRTYAETLCLIFFPGAKFSQSEDGTSDTPRVNFNIVQNSNIINSEVTVSANGKNITANAALNIGNYSTEKAIKLSAGRAMLEAGYKMFGITPPWGILTGVRPSKVATAYINNGMTVQEAARELESVYAVSESKAKLTADVAFTEEKIINSVNENDCAVYISIPFCPTRCAYCSFVSYTSPRLLSLIPDYINVLADDIKRTFKRAKDDGKCVTSIYIGGGTPTILTSVQLEYLLSEVAKYIDVSSLTEYTLEGGRPDTITYEKLKVAKEYGVNRISINPQSLDNEVLKTIGRTHTTDDFYRAFEIARNSGIKCINTDIIAGLPSDNDSKFQKTIDGVVKLKPENVTVHTFCVKVSADIKKQDGVFILNGKKYELHAQNSVGYSQSTLINSGYSPYYMYRQKNMVDGLENVGYSLPGYESLYNIVMMEEVCNIYAAGAGAVTKLLHREDGKLKIERIFNVKYPYEYLRQ